MDIICLSETKQQDDYIRDKACELGFFNSIIVSALGLSGGLVMLWKQAVEVSIYFQSPHLVDCFIKSNEVGFYFFFVYAHPNPSFINEVWEQLERIGIGRGNLPWLIMGDFNEIGIQ